MNNLLHKKIIEAFEIYKGTVFMVDVDLKFWQSFMKLSIKDYKIKYTQTDDIFQSVFNVYNIDPKTSRGLLKTMKSSYSRKSIDLEDQSKDFFTWIMILAILKMYNALELFLLYSIHLKFSPSLKDPLQSKKAIGIVQNEIKKNLTQSNIKLDLKNNRQIIEFLKAKSTSIKSFLSLPVRTDLTTNWENFFELISILRNMVAHHGTIITRDAQNEINSKAKDVFDRYFEVSKNKNGYSTLKPRLEQFPNLIHFFNDFAINVVKLLFNQSDLTFLAIA
jgi:ribosomal protein L31E